MGIFTLVASPDISDYIKKEVGRYVTEGILLQKEADAVNLERSCHCKACGIEDIIWLTIEFLCQIIGEFQPFIYNVF